MGQSHLRVLVAPILELNFNLWTIGISRAYFPAKRTLKRNVLIKLDIIELARKKLFQVVKPLDCLADVENYSSQTLASHHKEDPNIK